MDAAAAGRGQLVSRSAAAAVGTGGPATMATTGDLRSAATLESARSSVVGDERSGRWSFVVTLNGGKRPSRRHPEGRSTPATTAAAHSASTTATG
jgi:hypothetical protein